MFSDGILISLSWYNYLLISVTNRYLRVYIKEYFWGQPQGHLLASATYFCINYKRTIHSSEPRFFAKCHHTSSLVCFFFFKSGYIYKMEESNVIRHSTMSRGSPQESHCHSHSDILKWLAPVFAGKICKQRESKLQINLLLSLWVLTFSRISVLNLNKAGKHAVLSRTCTVVAVAF